jgi:hypothetical protein
MIHQPSDPAIPNEARMPEHHDISAERCLQAVASALDADPERLLVLSESSCTLVHSGRSARVYLVFDSLNGCSAWVALDEAGNRVDVDELMEAEAAAAHRHYGAMQPALHALLNHVAEADRRIPVLIRYRIPDDDGLDKFALDARALHGAASIRPPLARRDAAVEERAAALHRETMRDLGVELTDEPPVPTGPFVPAVLSPNALRALARDERIGFVGLDAEPPVPDFPATPEGRPPTRTEVVHASGFRGAGRPPAREPTVDHLVGALTGWLAAHSITALRISLGLVIAGFGALKYVPGASPAEGLVMKTVDAMTLSLVTGTPAVVITAVLETYIGLVLLTGRGLRVGLVVMAGWLAGIMAPVVLLPGELFPAGLPTLAAQYVLKDVILAAAAAVVAAHTLGARLRVTPRQQA